MASRPAPKKLFYRIHEVAELIGVEAYVLRYWETRFPTLKPERFASDERRYREKDVELLRRIKALLQDHRYTIAGAVDKIKRDPTGAFDAEFDHRPPGRANIIEQQLDLLSPLPNVPAQSPVADALARLRELRLELEQLLG
jgi:DNA-binding transcriptional MerR regulator